MSEEAPKVLSAEGGAHILVELGEGPKRFKELMKSIPLSSRTLDRRLKESSLWEPDLAASEEGSHTRVYRLTSEGKACYEVAVEQEFPELSKRIRREEEKFEEDLSEFLERLSE